MARMRDVMDYVKVARAWTYLTGEAHAVMHHNDSLVIVRASELPGTYQRTDVIQYCRVDNGLPYAEARGGNVCGLPRYHRLRLMQPKRNKR